MTHITWRSLILIAALAGIAESAYGQTSPICVTSDAAEDTGCGTNALTNGSSDGGNSNSAFGYEALFNNTTGSSNTASGVYALGENTTGSYNTATGYQALESNITASGNSAFGFAALSHSSGPFNTAIGYDALAYNLSGNNNTASGYNALVSNTTGNRNTANGVGALYSNLVGSYNAAFGYQALRAQTGNNNIAVGYRAGFNVTSGSYNIDIGNLGAATDGVATDSGVIRIGTQTPTALQTKTYIAGIYYNNSVSGIPVVIDSNGQLGTEATSSERFKTDVAPMASKTAKLQQLRPVTFHYKADPQGALRYGLIAEEVAEVYPELVVRDSKGRIDAVRYDELAPMLLNEMQKQAAKIRTLEQQVARVNDLEHELAEMRTALTSIKSNDQLVVQR